MNSTEKNINNDNKNNRTFFERIKDHKIIVSGISTAISAVIIKVTGLLDTKIITSIMLWIYKVTAIVGKWLKENTHIIIAGLIIICLIICATILLYKKLDNDKEITNKQLEVANTNSQKDRTEVVMEKGKKVQKTVIKRGNNIKYGNNHKISVFPQKTDRR